MKIGLFFGSFNPIHVGHLIIGNYMATQTDLQQVWYVVSPHNPLKKKATLAPDYDRLHLVELAIDGNPNLRASNIEFALPQPSYTVDTLVHLAEKYPMHEFVLIMGGDNLGTLHKWKNYEVLLRDYQLYVYQRPDYDLGELADHGSVRIYEAPLMQISSSYIRQCIKEDLPVDYLVVDKVRDYLSKTSLYR